MREQSLIVHGGQIFNLLPYDIKNWSGSADTFKSMIDDYLEKIPDQPATTNLYPAPVNRTNCGQSNSLYDWIFHLKLNERK